MFETDYPSGALYYNLGGYRVAKHILIKFDDEYSDKLKNMKRIMILQMQKRRKKRHLLQYKKRQRIF